MFGKKPLQLAFLSRFQARPDSSPILFAGVIFSSLLIRIIYVAFVGEYLLEGDSLSYIGDFLNVYTGVPYSPFWAPGLPLLLGWINLNWALFPLSLTLFSLAVYLLCVVGIFLTLQELLPGSFSTLPLVLFCFSPTAIHFSVVPLTQMPTATGLIWCFYLLIKASSHPQRVASYALGVGLIMGICVLLRPSCMILLPFIAYLCFKIGRYKALGGYFLLLLLVIGSWQIRNYATGHPHIFINTSNGYNFFVGNNPYTPGYKTWWLGTHLEVENPTFEGYYDMLKEIGRLAEKDRTEAFFSEAINHIKTEPKVFVKRTLSRIRTFWATDTFSGGFLHQNFSHRAWTYGGVGGDLISFSLLIGMSIRGLSKTSIALSSPFSWLIGLLLIFPLPYYLAFSHPTYHFPLFPFLCIFASKGLGTKAPFRPGPKTIMEWILGILFIAIQLEWFLRLFPSLD